MSWSVISHERRFTTKYTHAEGPATPKDSSNRDKGVFSIYFFVIYRENILQRTSESSIGRQLKGTYLLWTAGGDHPGFSSGPSW